MSKLSANDYDMFLQFGVGSEMLDAGSIERVTDEEARNDYGITGTGDMSGIVFPYSIGNGRVTCRIRRDHPDVDERGRPLKKYISPHGDVRHLYVPPGAKELLADDETEIMFVEAEKSSLAVTAWGTRNGRKLIALATGGCWGWKGIIGKSTSPDGARIDVKGPLPETHYAKDRRATILFDANAATSPEVKDARGSFAAELKKIGASSVSAPNLPTLGSVNVNGPDDFIREFGDKAFAVVIDTPASPEELRPPVVWDSPDFLKQVFPPREPFVSIQSYGTPVFTSHSLNMIFAWRGTGKSLLINTLAGHASVGQPFLNWEILRPLRVMIVDGELPDTQIQERWHQVFPPGAHVRLISLDSQYPGTIPSFATAEGQRWLEVALQHVELLILDSMASLAPFDKNKEEEWDCFLFWLMRLRSRGLCVIILQQAGKGGLQRGHSRADDFMDVQIKLAADEDEARDYLKCDLTYEKFRGPRSGVRALSLECRRGLWTWTGLEADKLRILEEYTCLHPKDGSRKIAEALPELGTHFTVLKLLRQLDKRAKGAPW